MSGELPNWRRAHGAVVGSGVIRAENADFQVTEQLGFEPGGGGEHAWLLVEKNGLTTHDLVQRVARLANVPRRDVGLSGLKDRNAITRQWLSVQLAGRADPDWGLLEDDQVRVIETQRHPRKLRRGVHTANVFRLKVSALTGDVGALETRLTAVRSGGVPNYFGPQRFGRRGRTLSQALAWARGGGVRLRRTERSLYLSALRSYLFNVLLDHRVASGNWESVDNGDVCILDGSRSLFVNDGSESNIDERARRFDLHPGLPLWGSGERPGGAEVLAEQDEQLTAFADVCRFLEAERVELAHRPARVMPDDFSWEFCDDGVLRLAFSLAVGSFATALLREVVDFKEQHGSNQPGETGEQ